jgi:ferrous iron transport protein B
MINQNINVALIGNPNTGKTSVFNQLTGLNQQVGITESP